MSTDGGAAATNPFGPLQMLVIGSERTEFTGEILPELKRLSDAGIVRLVDLMVVRKDRGELEVVQVSELDENEALEFGALIGALVGLGVGGEDAIEAGAELGAAEMADGHILDDGDVWFLADVIPDTGWAAIALLEHRWAIPLRDKIVDAGGYALADEWIHPQDLVAVGANLAAKYSVGTSA
jgi:uncharacterized membrane protein